MAKLTIADRTAELILDMASWEELEERVGKLDDIDAMFETRQRLKHYRETVEILAAEGARLGKGDEMPADWIKENARPAQVRLMTAAIRLAIVDGMRMETAAEGNGGAVDVTLAEIEKKDQKDD
jgi:hypothetical protein